MKLLVCILILATSYLVTSCKKDDTKPMGLSGDWVLIQKKTRTDLTSKTVTQSIPSSPSQAITFNYPNTFKNTILQDTLFTSAKYFQISAGDIAAPSISLFDTHSFNNQKLVSSFFYAVYQDSLRMNTGSGQQLIEYKFYRLR